MKNNTKIALACSKSCGSIGAVPPSTTGELNKMARAVVGTKNKSVRLLTPVRSILEKLQDDTGLYPTNVIELAGRDFTRLLLSVPDIHTRREMLDTRIEDTKVNRGYAFHGYISEKLIAQIDEVIATTPSLKPRSKVGQPPKDESELQAPRRRPLEPGEKLYSLSTVINAAILWFAKQRGISLDESESE